ncbi:MAG: deoxyribonuclease IV [Bacilli bacterium]|nr:deoxyribonuclease IV [Bacilli bacterium]
MADKIYLGSHVSMSSPEYYLGSVKEALSYGANTFMFYTGAPQNTFRLPVEKLRIAEGRALIKEAGLDENKIIVHAPYILNIANQLNESLYQMAKDHLTNELRRVQAFGLKILVLHPGSHVGTGIENGLDSIVKALDEVLDNDGTDVKIALETMAGKGGEMGSTFEQLHHILTHIKHPERVGVCFDTCHVNDEGVDISKVDETIEIFDRVIGLDKLLCIHINDSKNPLGSHKDRHENIGYGEIGFDTLCAYIHHPKLDGIPKILETPYINKVTPPYKKEIEMLLNKEFIEGWRD